jgi:ATP-dependent DNA helicase RecQ
VPKSKVRVILSALEQLGLVAQDEDGRFVRVGPPVQEADIEHVSRAYEERHAADRERLERMVLYSQTAMCRWKVLLEYFGESVGWTSCGHCDACRRPAAAVQPAEHRDFTPEGIHVRDAVRDAALPPRHASLRAGDTVLVPVHGLAEVQKVENDKVELRFANGAVRKFKREFLESTGGTATA